MKTNDQAQAPDMASWILAAGGTGGHINAAIAIGEFLERSGFNQKPVKIIYVSGQRELDYKLFKNYTCYHFHALSLVGKNPLFIIKSFFFNFLVFLKAFFLFLKNKPNGIIGCGGYICGPTLLAGYLLGIPIYSLEQNSVMGLTNKLLAKISRKIFLNFSEVKNFDQKKYQDKTYVVGNPMRFNLNGLTGEGSKNSETLQNILIFGGSLGSSEINNAIFDLIHTGMLKSKKIIWQTGLTNFDEIKNKLKSQNIDMKQIEVLAYLDDMDKYYNWADVIISRSGASTVSELEVVGKCCILIPYQHLDQHQYYNAVNLQKNNEFFVGIVKNSPKESPLSLQLSNLLKEIETHLHFTKVRPKTNNATQLIWNELSK